MKKKKIIFVIPLFLIAAVIFGSYMRPSGGMDIRSVDSKTKTTVINFCREMMKIAKEKKAHEFIKKSANPKDIALKDFFLDLQQVSETENSKWYVEMESERPDICYVKIINDNGKIQMMVEKRGEEWKFRGVII